MCLNEALRKEHKKIEFLEQTISRNNAAYKNEMQKLTNFYENGISNLKEDYGYMRRKYLNLEEDYARLDYHYNILVDKHSDLNYYIMRQQNTAQNHHCCHYQRF